MASSDPIRIQSDLLLVHEGTADLKVFGALRRHASIGGFQNFKLDGLQKMRGFLKGLALAPHFKSPVPGHAHPVRALGIGVDAEANAADTFQSVRNSLMAAGLPAPHGPGEITGRSLRVGVFLVPDNRSAGKIETLLLRSVENDPAFSCVEPFFRCVNERGGTLPANLEKAHSQAFLSTRPIPDLRVGLAADEGYWNFGSAAFVPLIEFFRALAAPF